MSTLLAGDTGWWTEEALQLAFGENEKVSLLDGDAEALGGKANSLGADDADKVAQAVRLGFDHLVYVSREFSNGAENVDGNELESLSELLASFLESHTESPKVLYIGPDSAVARRGAARVASRALEDICRLYRDEGIDVEVVRAPRLCSPTYSGDFWNRACTSVREKSAWTFQTSADEPCRFLEVNDLGRLVHAIIQDWGRAGVMRVPVKTPQMYGQAARRIGAEAPAARISFSESEARPPVRALDDGAPSTEELYGIAPAFDAERAVAEAWAATASPADGRVGRMRRVARKMANLAGRPWEPMTAGRAWLLAAELLVGWALVEWLGSVLGNTYQFRMIDLRLLYVILFAATYGVGAGIAAAVVMGLSLAAAFVALGYAPEALFFDPRNWVPFVLYLMAGSAVGYLRQKAVEDIAFADRRSSRLDEQARFLEGLYNDACESRNAYRRDLLESRDGFGRIFDVVKRLSLEEPSRIFSASIGVLEDVLDTRKAAIYVVNARADGYARLVVNSKELTGHLPKSLPLEALAPAREKLDAGEVWFNAGLDPDLPSYIAGVRSEGKVRVVIMIYDVPFEQATSYYMNLIRILAGLMENFLIHAWHDEAARARERFVEGTVLLAPKELRAELETMRQMRADRVSDFRILRVDGEGRSLKDLSALLEKQVRPTDRAGVGEDGRVYVLLSQVDDRVVPIVQRRYEEAGLRNEVCGEEALQ